VGLREKGSVLAGRLEDTLQILKTQIESGLILSTCNRTEIYNIENGNCNGDSRALSFLESYFSISGKELAEHTYHYVDRQVAEHLFAVASGLDSMIIGEYEVLGQVKNALEHAEAAGSVNLPLRRLFQDAIRIGRRVREETGISKNALSVSSVAVELAAVAVGDLSRKKMLLVADIRGPAGHHRFDGQGQPHPGLPP
jgi:glutamyl-tRNA reductase